MRLRCTLAVLVTLVPLVLRSQPAPPPQVLGTYALSGCMDGTLRYDGFTPVRGQVACFGGTARLELTPFDAQFQLLRMKGSITATFDPAFTAAGIHMESATSSAFRFTYDDAAQGAPCTSGCAARLGFPGIGGVAFAVVGSQPFEFQTEFLSGLFPASTVFADVRDMRGLFWFTWLLRSDPGGCCMNGTVNVEMTSIAQVTATPEPSTLALLAAGSLVLAGVARRKRSTATTPNRSRVG
jgi:hypothetical protein